MSNLKFKLNKKGVSELMKSSEMQHVLAEYASRIKNRCGAGFEQDAFVGKKRANVSIRAQSRSAQKDNLENNTLLKAVR